MKSVKFLAGTLAVLGGSMLLAPAQSPFLYRLTFRGTCYQTNATGDFYATPLTEQTFIQDAARSGNVDPKSIALVYHLQNGGLGDTIDVVNAANGSTIVSLFGLYFGDDSTLGRTAATNATMTEVRRLDYIYTQQNSTYTSFNTHSMGSAFTTKRFVYAVGPNGTNVNTTVDAQMSWIVNPMGSSGTKLCTGSFTTTTPFP